MSLVLLASPDSLHLFRYTMLFEGKTWTAEQLSDDLASAGIHTGTNLIVHSSLKAVGRTTHGAQTVVDALRLAQGPFANLMVPTFTYSIASWKTEPYSHHGSRARTGAIPEYIRTHPGAIRSLHPTHSVAVMGPDAKELTARHMNFTALGSDSPFDRMRQKRAKILMLGTRQDTNSSLHLVEVLIGLKYIRIPFTNQAEFELAWMINDDDEIEFVPIYEVPGCSKGFRAIEKPLIERGVLREIVIGQAQSQLLDMQHLLQACTEILHDNPTLLLCHHTHCAICPKRRNIYTR